MRAVRFRWLLAPVAVACVAAAGAPIAQDAIDRNLEELAREAGQPDPLMRIGLEADDRLLLSCSSGLRLLDPATRADVWHASFEGEVAIVTEGGGGEVATRFRVQVGAFQTRQAAENERDRLARRHATRGTVRRDPDRGNRRVRLGEANDRLALNPLMERLRADGYRDLWIAEEPVEEAAGVTLRVVDRQYRSLATGLTRLVAVASGRGRLRVGERSFRGVIELRVSRTGTVQAINWVGLEPYLLGVVPAELGPEVWPQLEALRAQAVAARTYAWRNRGQFADDGYDICATPRCQVYEGAGAEHPLSDRAVASTRGEILTWRGSPINSYYTATCGGHTEDVGNVFPGESAEYLRGVPCRAEEAALASMRGTIEAAEPLAVRDEAGHDVTRDRALLIAAGVLDASADASLGEPLEPSRLRRWTAALASVAGRPAPQGPPGAVDTLGAAVATLTEDLGWAERASVLLSDADLPALLRDADASALEPEQRRALAYLVALEGLRPFPGGDFRAAARPTGARLLRALARVGEAYEAFGLRSAVVSRIRGRRLVLVEGKGERKLDVRDLPALFRWAGGEPVPVRSLELWPGDRVRFRTDGGGRIDFLEVVPPIKGASDDRSSVLYSWEVRRTRHELERDVNRRVSVGRVEDLQVVRRGVSGRVAEMRVVGSEGEALIRGFDVRRLLGLRESLIVVEPQRDAAGRIEAVVFAGKGWGHGVGMCQVGAYGMALRGAGYREVLDHYYRGASIEKVHAGRRRAP